MVLINFVSPANMYDDDNKLTVAVRSFTFVRKRRGQDTALRNVRHDSCYIICVDLLPTNIGAYIGVMWTCLNSSRDSCQRYHMTLQPHLILPPRIFVMENPGRTT